jgi:hypothetical protein
MLSFSIPYLDLIRKPYFVDPLKEKIASERRPKNKV